MIGGWTRDERKIPGAGIRELLRSYYASIRELLGKYPGTWEEDRIYYSLYLQPALPKKKGKVIAIYLINFEWQLLTQQHKLPGGQYTT